jgi:RNA-directed DNA polymerase
VGESRRDGGGKLHAVEEGTPQGGIISPLLANLYLHYVLDLWALSWRKKRAHGEVYIVRLDERLAKFGLKLHPEKTRVIRFGRFARENRRERGLPKPETFEFLGFVHIAGLSREGKFQLHRRTSRKKRRAKLIRLKGEVRKRRHAPVVEQHAWLSSVLTGHYRYYGVPTNIRDLAQFRERVSWMWHASLQRRRQRGRWTWAQRRAFMERFPLPRARIHHPWPNDRFELR